MDCLMGVDLGSTSLKAVIYDLNGKALASGSRPTIRTADPEHPDWTVWLPEDIWGGAATPSRSSATRAASRASPSPAWEWTACPSAKTASGSIR